MKSAATGYVKNVGYVRQTECHLRKEKLNRIFNWVIAGVWLVNGLLCKVLNLVPRHERIVARITGSEFSEVLTTLIGLGEIAMACWIISGWKAKQNAIIQIILVATMNILEFWLAPDLLLWGRFNILFAFLFMLLIYCNEFTFQKKRSIL